MRLEVTKDSFGWLIGLRSSSSSEFDEALRSLKDCVPDNCRNYDSAKRQWRVHLRAERYFSMWVGSMEARGAVVVDPTVRQVKRDKPGDVRSRLLLARARKELCLRPEASPALAEAVYPLLVAEHAGDGQKLVELAAAIAVIRGVDPQKNRQAVA
jgi:hypothetical protein